MYNLEWDSITAELAKCAVSEAGKARCLDACVYSDVKTIEFELKQTSEMKYLLDRAVYPPLSDVKDTEEALDMLKTGMSLSEPELVSISYNLSTARQLRSFFGKYNEETPLLHELSQKLFHNRELEDNIREKFDDAGNMLDSASPTLRSLRLSLRDQTENLKNRLISYINSPEIAKMLQNSAYTMRGDRYVIPVRVEHKAHIPGIVHDMSSSGATVFIEPENTVAPNNKIRQTRLEIDAEVKKILSELSAQVREHSNELKASLEILAETDFILAKARYSVSIRGIEPKINTEKYISLKGVRHPVLVKILDNVVPNNIEIGRDYRIMVITGPNTGGKTVILKTIGLCTLMTRAGMHIPAEEADIYPFPKVFADIGDEQSLNQSLSTFSGHIKNIIEILENTDEDTLVLLDEPGAGTDPMEGSTLAGAIMENILQKGAKALITTHFSELKSLAYTNEGFYNASVEFDTDTLSPTYRLLMGIPGKSNAIFIAQRLGLDNEIIEKAKSDYLNKKDPTGRVLEELQHTQQQLSRETREIAEKKGLIEELERNYSDELEKIRAEKKKIIGIYRKKFDTAFFQAKEEIGHILEEARQNRSEKTARKSLSVLGDHISKARKLDYEETDRISPDYKLINWDKAKQGDTVFVKNLGKEGIITQLPDKNGNVQVEIGVLKTTVNRDELFYPEKPVKKQEKPSPRKGFSIDRKRMANTVDVRGETAKDALSKVEHYLDEASLANLSPVYIIHGHGTGKLRKEIRDYLQKSPYVAGFRPGEQAEGGDGVTFVELV